MAPVDEEIRVLGQKRDTEGLQNYIEAINVDRLISAVVPKLVNANFEHTWNYILQGFTDSPECHRKRFKLTQRVIKEIEGSAASSTQNCGAIAQRLCMEFSKFKTEHLVELCNFCMECIQSRKMSQMCWKDLLPELLNVIVERTRVEDEDTEMTGSDYKSKVVKSLCSIQWSPDIVTSLAIMFIDMPLSKEEHSQVVNKLGQYMEKMTPQEIPPFVYQLLRLGKHSNSQSIFLRLQTYFGTRIYENRQQQNSESMGLDTIEEMDSHEAIEAESTVLFHIHSAASLGHECFRVYLASLKNVLKSPEFVLHPFQLSVLLVISTIPHYEERVFEIVRSCISRSLHEEQKKLHSAWFRDMVPTTCKVDAVFAQIIDLSAQSRELLLQGLVNFGFVLLGVGSALGRDIIAEKQWQLGNMILFKIIKRKRHIAPSIIQMLSNRIITENTVTQYIECMYMLSKNLALLMLENRSTIIMLMEGLLQMPPNNADQLLDAIIPLTKVSPTIRDHFIILLRKALYSRVSETRQMAVNGYIKLLTNLKITNLSALSQSSISESYNSGHSIFTQISVSRASQSAPSTFSSEALCLEILSILRRCFMQQAEVRSQLYDGLYDAVCVNPEIGIPVLEVIWTHFSQFYNMDEDTLPPLKLEKITITKDLNVSLQEPLGKLVFTIALIIAKLEAEDSDKSMVTKFTNILNSLSTRMAKCELVHFDLDDGTDLLDIVPEAQQKLFALKEAMSVYEALIGYKMLTWNQQSENCGSQINALFQGYCRLADFTKNLSKTKKPTNARKKKDQTTTQASQSTTSTVSKKDNAQKSRNQKLPDTILDFQVLHKTLNLLLEPLVPFATNVQTDVLRRKREFYQHVMFATFHVVSSLKNKKTIEVSKSKRQYEYLCEIAMVLFERVVKKLDTFVDFDCSTAVMGCECLLLILNLVSNQFKSNLRSFLSKVGGRDISEELVTHLTEIAGTYQKLFEMDEDTSTDPEFKKLYLVAINTLGFISNQLPVTSSSLSIQMMDWLKDRAVTNAMTNKQVATKFISVMFDTHVKFKISLTLLEQLSVNFGKVTGMIMEEEHDVEEFQIVSELTVHTIFVVLCNALKSTLEDIDWIIARLRSEFNMINYPGQEGIERRREYLKSKERGVTCQLCFVVSILTNLSNCSIPPGHMSEAVFKILSLLYGTLSSLANYFILRSSKVNPVFQGARFERLVKLAGKQLAPVVYKFISFVEDSQKHETKAAESKKKVDSSALKSKVLKQTRQIPKVVYEIEQFSKLVIRLSNKTKIDLSKFVGQGTVRDFRILHLNEVLEGHNETVDSDVTHDSTVLTEDNDNGEEENEEPSPPPAKKKKSCNKK